MLVVSKMQVVPCSGCGAYKTDDMKALQCDRCQSADTWQCVDCMHLSPEVYDQLVSDVSCFLRWFCERCDKSVTASNLKCNINKKLHYCKEHSASVVLSLCTSRHFSGENLLMANQPLFRNWPRKLPNSAK